LFYRRPHRDSAQVGLTYRVNQHVRVLADHQFHDALAPALPDSDVANRNLDEFDSLPALRVWVRYL
jgi:hypothetical protein